MGRCEDFLNNRSKMLRYLAVDNFFNNYAHELKLCVYLNMKTRVNLTIEDTVLKDTKIYAKKQGTSLSELVEEYLKSVIKPMKKNYLIELIEQLPKPDIEKGVDLKEQYYKDRAEKYGF
jgi:hypothetical protein